MLCYLLLDLSNKLHKMELLQKSDEIDEKCAFSETKFNITYT